MHVSSTLNASRNSTIVTAFNFITAFLLENRNYIKVMHVPLKTVFCVNPFTHIHVPKNGLGAFIMEEPPEDLVKADLHRKTVRRIMGRCLHGEDMDVFLGPALISSSVLIGYT